MNNEELRYFDIKNLLEHGPLHEGDDKKDKRVLRLLVAYPCSTFYATEIYLKGLTITYMHSFQLNITYLNVYLMSSYLKYSHVHS